MSSKIAILGSTGSIGTQTLEVVKEHRNLLQVEGLAVGKNIPLLKSQVKQFSPSVVSMLNQKDIIYFEDIRKNKKLNVQWGEKGNIKIATIPDVNTVVVATPGLPGIKPTLEAIKRKKTIALATKEVLVSAGKIIMSETKKQKVKILPVDSEHSAIFQCLEGRNTKEVSSIYLTCSGGPFRGKKLNQLKKVTLRQALNHPNWKMGKKISIDSATLMNKGFEVIEAHFLFGIPLDKIKVIIHPQSIVHSAVEFLDGSIMAQIGPPDMRLPIQYALLYPKRQKNNFKRFSFSDYKALSFEEPDIRTFRCLNLAYRAAKLGGTTPAVLTAANDIAVEAFLDKMLPFHKIPEIIERALEAHTIKLNPTLDEIFESDSWTRNFTRSLIVHDIIRA